MWAGAGRSLSGGEQADGVLDANKGDRCDGTLAGSDRSARAARQRRPKNRASLPWAPDGDSRGLIVEQVPRTLSQSTTNRYTSIGADTRRTGSASGFVEVALGGDRSAVAVTLGGGIFVADATSSPVSSVITIDPVRILDRCTDVGLTGPFVSGVSQKLQVTGSVPMATGT